MEILPTVKMLLGINDNTQDDILNYYIQRVTDAILNYCSRDTLPPSLNSAVIEKVVALHKADTGVSGSGEIQSITRGNTTIQYAQKQASNAPDIIADITPTLDNFRMIRTPK